MKKTLSILLSFVMLLSIISGLSLSAYADTYSGYNYTVINGNEAEITGYFGSNPKILNIPSTCNSYTVTSIGEGAFTDRDDIVSVTIPSTVKNIGAYAFDYCTELTGVYINCDSTVIGDYAFEGCSKLVVVTFNGSATSIGDGCFALCTSLQGLTLSAATTAIGLNVFAGCSKLETISVESGNPYYYSGSDGVLMFDNGNKTLIKYPNNKPGDSYVIPDGVSAIATGAFDGVKNLKEVTIPASVTEIRADAFRKGSSITNIHYASTEDDWDDIAIADGNDQIDTATVDYVELPDPISTITVTGVKAPEKDAKPTYNANTASTAGYAVTKAYDDGNIKNGVVWKDVTDNKELKFTDTFKEGHAYQVTVFLRAKDSNAFPKSFTGKATVNGKAATAKPADPLAEAELLQDYVIVYTFDKIPAEPIVEPISFPDVKEGAWYYEAVMYCAQKGFVTGYANGNFGPNDNLKRQDFVVILARIAGANLDDYKDAESKLKDVKKGAYYAAAVNWAVDNNIIAGYANGNFGVNDNITREQVATILYRYMGSPETENIDTTLAKFKDVNRISSFAKTAVAWAVQNNVISGMADGRVAPTEGAARAQIASIIMRMDQQGMFNKA